MAATWTSLLPMGFAYCMLRSSLVKEAQRMLKKGIARVVFVSVMVGN